MTTYLILLAALAYVPAGMLLVYMARVKPEHPDYGVFVWLWPVAVLFVLLQILFRLPARIHHLLSARKDEDDREND